MPSEKELNEPISEQLKRYKDYVYYDKNLLIDQSLDIELTNEEKDIQRLIDSEIDNMVTYILFIFKI